MKGNLIVKSLINAVFGAVVFAILLYVKNVIIGGGTFEFDSDTIIELVMVAIGSGVGSYIGCKNRTRK